MKFLTVGYVIDTHYSDFKHSSYSSTITAIALHGFRSRNYRLAMLRTQMLEIENPWDPFPRPDVCSTAKSFLESLLQLSVHEALTSTKRYYREALNCMRYEEAEYVFHIIHEVRSWVSSKVPLSRHIRSSSNVPTTPMPGTAGTLYVVY